MCAGYTPSRKEQIEQHFGVRSPQLDLRPEVWPGYMALILRASHDALGEIEVAPACFGMVPHWADMKLARQTPLTPVSKLLRKSPHFGTPGSASNFA